MIKVLVSGACGRMGREVVKAVAADPELELVAAVDACEIGQDIGVLAGIGATGVNVSGDLGAEIDRSAAEVMVDFTVAEAAKKNIVEAAGKGVHCVVGTTGLGEADLEEIRDVAEGNKTSVFIAPNFAIGAVLMMKTAETVAKYMNAVEIIELHHDKKADAPSGTALLTAKKLVPLIERRQDPTKKEILAGSRGGDWDGVKIHSVRLPGFIAHQEVIFGGVGQTLTIRHDSIDRTSFMPGVVLAVKAVKSLRGVTIGLEKVLEP
ncbi:MAG: 4-hydroxy-tetrahydrodipicolinate reductase [Candidatus Aquicultorales bacterium]